MSNTINSQIRSNQYQSSNANTESVSGAQNIGYLEGRSNIQIGSDQLLTTRTPTVNNNPKNYIAMKAIRTKFNNIFLLERLSYTTDEELKQAYKELKVLIKQVKVENVNDKCHEDMTLLHFAARLKHSDIAEHLIEKGADINIQDEDKKTPLHYASEAKYYPSFFEVNPFRRKKPLICSDVFDLLLRKNADINIQDYEGNTPLHLSAVGDGDKLYSKYWQRCEREKYKKSAEVLSYSTNIVKKLINAGANLNIKNNLGNTPLNKFLEYSTKYCRDSVNILIAQPSCELNTQNNKGNTPLHQAARLENTDAINKLLEKKADCNILNEKGDISLNLAITRIDTYNCIDNLKMLKAFIKAGAKLDIRNDIGNTSLSQLIIKATIKWQNDMAINLINRNPDFELHYINNEGNTLLHNLMSSHNNEVITHILENYKIDINAKNENGSTPLHVLCNTIPENRCYSLSEVNGIINKLIEYGANINAKNKQGNTPLTLIMFMMTADRSMSSFVEDIIDYYSDIAIQLIECSANINIKNNNDDSPLHIAMRSLSRSKVYKIPSISKNLIESLITCSKDINAQDKNGNTPLHEAIGIEDSSVIFMLLDKGANLNIKNNLGNTPLHKAILALTTFTKEDKNRFHVDISEYYSDIAMKLIKCGANIDIKNNNDDTPLHLAMRTLFNGHTCFSICEIGKILIKRSKDINAQGKNGNTPLHEAIKLRAPSLSASSLIFMLLDKRANLNIKNNLGDTPLNQIMEDANIATVEIIKIFIKNGAEVNTQNNKGNAPLHKAMKFRRPYLADIFLTHGAKPNIQNKNGCTPLHIVQGLTTAERLIKAGASLKIKNNLENTPLNQIMDNVNIATVEMIKIFIKNGAEVNTQNNENYTPLHKAPDLETAQILIQAGADLRIKNNLENTPLNQIMDYTDSTTAEMIETFIINRAEVNTQNDEGNTPLHKAMQFKKPYLLDVLLIHGANLNIQNNNGNIPLHTAPDLETAQILIQAGADLRIKNNLGNTPLNQIEKLEQEDKPKVNHATTYNLDKIDLKELGDFNLSNIVLHQIVNRLINNGNDITDVFNKMHKIFKNALPSKTIESFLTLMSARSTSSRELFSIKSLQTIIRDLGKKIFFTKILEMHNIPLLVKALKANLYNENILYLCLFHAFINNDVTIYQEIDKSIKDKTIKFNDNEIKLFNKMHEIFVKMKSTDDKQILTTAEIITKYFSEDYLKEIAINLGIETFFTIILDMQNINLLHKVMETGLCNNNIIALGLFHAFIYGNHEIYDIFEKHIKNNISKFNNKELIALLQVPDYKNGVRILAEEAKQVVESETNQLFKKYIEFICSIEKLDKTEKFTILLHSEILNTLENQQIICEYFSIDDLKKIADDLNTEIFFTKIIEMQNIALLHKAMDAGLCDNNTISSNLLHQINALSKAL